MSVTPPTFRAIKNVKDDPDKVRLSNSPLSIRKQVDTLASKLRDPRFDFMFRPGDWLPSTDGAVQADLDRLLEDWVGGPEPIAVLDLSGIPPAILKDLIGALLRILYNAMFWARERSEGGRERPLLFVLEEAHAYLGKDQSGSAADAVKRIAKEGRKYGVGVMLVSQRPSESDATILSQCGTIFAMRLANDTELPEEELSEIRQHARTGRPLGDETFLERLEGMVGRILKPQKRGRSPNKAN